MSFLKKDPINNLNDLSNVNPEIEDKSTVVLTLEILLDSIFDILPVLLLIITESLSLIFLGHNYDKTEMIMEIKYFNFYAIGVVFINLFGFIFALGTTRSLKKENLMVHNYYKNLKTILISIVVVLILPISLLSFLLLSSFYSTVNQETNSMLWYLYLNFLIFAPISVYFSILLQLNLRMLQLYNKRSVSLWIFILHFFFQTVSLYIFEYKLDMDIKGVIISVTIASFLCYIYSNSIINENILYFQNFYFIPDFNSIDWDIFSKLKYKLFSGVTYYLGYAGFGFFLLLAYFIDDISFSSNIILFNFLSLLHLFGQGFSNTMKHYIHNSMINYKHSHIGKKKYIKFLSVIAFVIALSFSVGILTLDGAIVRIYICYSENLGNTLPQGESIEQQFNQICNFYALIIFFDYLSQILDGYVKGINAKTTHLLVYKISFLLLFIPAGLILCFYFELGLMGFWAAIYTYIVIYTIFNSFYVYKYYLVWMN